MENLIKRATARIRKLEKQRAALREALQDAREEIFEQQGHTLPVAQCDKILEETK